LLLSGPQLLKAEVLVLPRLPPRPVSLPALVGQHLPGKVAEDDHEEQDKQGSEVVHALPVGLGSHDDFRSLLLQPVDLVLEVLEPLFTIHLA
jgi:hypothetical protein